MYIKPTPYKDKPGFYEIPGFSKYAISKDGILWSKLQQREVSGFIGTSGYHSFSMYRDDTGKKYCTGRHRILCLVFKNDGRDYKGWHVNHIDHTPGSDSLDNLEWVTPSENMLHKYINGRRNIAAPVEVRNPKTGEITIFHSMGHLCKDLGIHKYVVENMLAGPDWRIYPCGLQVRYASNEPWPPLPESDEEIERIMLHNGTEKSIIVKWLISGKEKVFTNMTTAAKALGIAPSTLSVWISENPQRVCVGGFLLKYLFDDTPWRSDITSMYEMFNVYNNQGQRKVVQKTNAITGGTTYYWTAASAAKDSGIAVTALDYRLKTNGESVFDDMCCYGYYPF